MRLRKLTIRNFGCIGDPGYDIAIDRIVVLIGRNNVGKSTVFDAYEALASAGTPRPRSQFHQQDETKPIEIGATFGDVTADDIQT